MRKLLITIIVLAIAGVSIYYFAFGGKEKLSQITSDDKPAENQPAPAEPDSVFAEPVTYGSLKQGYDHPAFSFKYSDGFKVSAVPAGTKEEIVTVENAKGSGFQVYIMPWDEAGPITPERIWQDMPEADVLEPKNALLDEVKTLVFYGYNEDMGETFEAWAVYKGKLYQISGPKTAEDLVIETLETWDWK